MVRAGRWALRGPYKLPQTQNWLPDCALYDCLDRLKINGRPLLRGARGDSGRKCGAKKGHKLKCCTCQIVCQGCLGQSSNLDTDKISSAHRVPSLIDYDMLFMGHRLLLSVEGNKLLPVKNKSSGLMPEPPRATGEVQVEAM